MLLCYLPFFCFSCLLLPSLHILLSLFIFTIAALSRFCHALSLFSPLSARLSLRPSCYNICHNIRHNTNLPFTGPQLVDSKTLCILALNMGWRKLN